MSDLPANRMEICRNDDSSYTTTEYINGTARQPIVWKNSNDALLYAARYGGVVATPPELILFAYDLGLLVIAI